MVERTIARPAPPETKLKRLLFIFVDSYIVERLKQQEREIGVACTKVVVDELKVIKAQTEEQRRKTFSEQPQKALGARPVICSIECSLLDELEKLASVYNLTPGEVALVCLRAQYPKTQKEQEKSTDGLYPSHTANFLTREPNKPHETSNTSQDKPTIERPITPKITTSVRVPSTPYVPPEPVALVERLRVVFNAPNNINFIRRALPPLSPEDEAALAQGPLFTKEEIIEHRQA